MWHAQPEAKHQLSLKAKNNNKRIKKMLISLASLWKQTRKQAAYHRVRLSLHSFLWVELASITQLNYVLYQFWIQKYFRTRSHVTETWWKVMPGLVAVPCAYSQVSRLSLSMCEPERTVSISIRRSELRPSGMQGISSSPSLMGSIGSCRAIDGGSLGSPDREKNKK